MTLSQLKIATRSRGVFPTLDAMRRMGMTEAEISCLVSRSALSKAEKGVYGRLVATPAQFVT